VKRKKQNGNKAIIQESYGDQAGVSVKKKRAPVKNGAFRFFWVWLSGLGGGEKAGRRWINRSVSGDVGKLQRDRQADPRTKKVEGLAGLLGRRTPRCIFPTPPSVPASEGFGHVL
jgi:hypothetical protein